MSKIYVTKCDIEASERVKNTVSLSHKHTAAKMNKRLTFLITKRKAFCIPAAQWFFFVRQRWQNGDKRNELGPGAEDTWKCVTHSLFICMHDERKGTTKNYLACINLISHFSFLPRGVQTAHSHLLALAFLCSCSVEIRRFFFFTLPPPSLMPPIWSSSCSCLFSIH